MEEPADRPTVGDANTVISSSMGEADSSKRKRIEEAITITRADDEGVQYPHNDDVVVTLNIANYNVHRMLVDNRSSIDILFHEVLLKMNIFSEWYNMVLWEANSCSKYYFTVSDNRMSSPTILGAPSLHGHKDPLGI